MSSTTPSSIVAVDDAYMDDNITSFDSFNLDPRLSQAMKSLSFKRPTLIQSSFIPLAINERVDIVAKASTGSGKTLAYTVPMIESLLEQKTGNPNENKFHSVIFVPTKELAGQVTQFVKLLTTNCGDLITILNLSSASNSDNDRVTRKLFMDKPNIIVTTPNKLAKILTEGNSDNQFDMLNTFKNELKIVTFDEVDLILSYGYEDDLSTLQSLINFKKTSTLQIFLMSATLEDEILNSLKKDFLKEDNYGEENTNEKKKSYRILRLNDEKITKNKDKLVQYFIKTSEFDKFLIIFIILKLNLIKGKILLFVNNLDRSYRLKLFLDQFGIKSCILNNELPLNSRLHIIDQYNKNLYNLLIATDDANYNMEVDEDENAEKIEPPQENNTETLSEKQQLKQNTKSNTTRSKKTKDKEYGVSRGVDFKNVSCVLNFDLPTTSKNYIHRIGRTARASNSGIALSFVVNEKDWGKHKASSLMSAKKDEKIFGRILNKQRKIGLDILPYKFNEENLNSFRYRVEDAFRTVTNNAIKEARIKELKTEILNSDKLRRHFEENPQDLEVLRHDKDLHGTHYQSHLKKPLPNYLLPKNMQTKTKNPSFVPFNNKVSKKKNRSKKGGKRANSRKKDPLKTFKR